MTRNQVQQEAKTTNTKAYLPFEYKSQLYIDSSDEEAPFQTFWEGDFGDDENLDDEDYRVDWTAIGGGGSYTVPRGCGIKVHKPQPGMEQRTFF